jgi:hypothetical protein
MRHSKDMSELFYRQLIDGLAKALREQWPDHSEHSLEILKAKGLAHDHVRLLGTGWLARIPKQSQMRLNALDNLLYQQACFERVSPAEHAPRCIKLLQPCENLPRGALIVEEIVGRSAQLPHDLPLMARSLASMHRLALPVEAGIAPLIYACDPLHALWDEIKIQAQYLPAAQLEPAVLHRIQSELTEFHALCKRDKRPERRLIAFDGHPGNFVITSERAFLVDLEKCRYSYPSLDLAHATLYTSTTWDIDSHQVLSTQEIMTTYRAWSDGVDAALASDAAAWHLPLRRAMWLWSVTWCAKWRVASREAASISAEGEDWSDENLSTALAKHVRGRVDHYLSAEGVGCVVSEWEQLAKLLAGESV